MDIAKIVPTRPRSVYDVTGAGDMVLATLAVTLACGCDYETAVHIANTAGGLEVEKFGAATVTVDEIITELDTTDIGEREGRAQDKEDANTMQKLRALGYM